MSHEEFARVCGPVFEKSPWIAERASAKRPCRDFAELLGALCGCVLEAGLEKHLALIHAHPDLAGRMVLTSESQREQASAGLTALAPCEMERFRQCNEAYRNRFGFPFVICARLNNKEAILAAFELRLGHSREQEVKAALEEIFKIAELRLRDLIV